MSLDVSLILNAPIEGIGTGVFIREDGATKELSIEEVREKFPTADVSLEKYETNEVYSGNITHNLNQMAMAAGLYDALWRPEEQNWEVAGDIIATLEEGLAKLLAEPDQFKKHNPENNWGDYDGFVKFVENYLVACKANPEAKIDVSR